MTKYSISNFFRIYSMIFLPLKIKYGFPHYIVSLKVFSISDNPEKSSEHVVVLEDKPILTPFLEVKFEDMEET